MPTKALISGTVTLSGDRTFPWVGGPGERIKAERHFGVKIANLADEISEEYIAFLAYTSLVKQKVEGLPSTFDAFLDEIDDYEIDDDAPEPATPPVR
jgi:hypothetical protein